MSPRQTGEHLAHFPLPWQSNTLKEINSNERNPKILIATLRHCFLYISKVSPLNAFATNSVDLFSPLSSKNNCSSQSYWLFFFFWVGGAKPNKLVPSASLQIIFLNLLFLFFGLSLSVVIFQCNTPIKNSTQVVIHCLDKTQITSALS